jgi:hypothetical protein
MTSAGRPPSAARMIAASLLSIVASLGADALLVKLGTSLFPSIRGYSHFRITDYGTLTVVGVIAACAAWPVTTRISSTPRGLFLRLAIVVTLTLWLPDLWLLVKHEQARAVAVLMAMHVAIAFITYTCLVNLATPRSDHLDDPAIIAAAQSPPGELIQVDLTAASTKKGAIPRLSRPVWIAMTSGVCAEFTAGIAALFLVPFSRPNEWISTRSEAVYLVHAILGGVLVLGAMAILIPASREGRLAWSCAIVGFVGIALGAAGGFLSIYHRWRLLGLALMFLGAMLAFFAYLIPSTESPSDVPGTS